MAAGAPDETSTAARSSIPFKNDGRFTCRMANRPPADAPDALRSVPLFYAWTGIGLVVSYLFRILLARSLTPEQYGTFYAVIGFIGFLLIFNDFGLGSSFLFHMIRWKESPRKSAGVFTFVVAAKLCIALLLGGLLLLFHDAVAIHFFRNPSLGPVLTLFSVFFLFETLLAIAAKYFAATGRLHLYAAHDHVRMALILLFSVAALLFLPPPRILTGFFFAWFLSFVVAGTVGALLVPFRRLTLFRPVPGVAKTVTLFALFTFFSAAADIILSRIDILFITYYRSAVEVGLYEVAVPVATMLTFFFAPLNKFLGPMVMHRRREQSSFLSDTLSGFYGAGLFLLLPLALILILYASEVIVALFGAAYLAATPALVILTVQTFLFSFVSLNLLFLYSLGYPKTQMYILYAAAAVKVLLNLAFVPRFGFIGAAATTLLSTALLLLATVVALRRHVRFRVSFRALGLTFLLAALTFASALTLKRLLALPLHLEAGLIGVTFLLCYYCVGLFLFRLADWRQLLGLARRFLHGFKPG